MTLPENDMLLKIGAAAVAAWLLLSPYLSQIQGWFGGILDSLNRPAPPQPKPEIGTLEYMKIILEMANRFRLSGNEKVVDVCQELIDLMLHGEEK
jgi:hypothetical protein